jgi:hypothetical protein
MSGTATYVYCLVQRVHRPSMSRAPRGLAGASKPTLLDVGRSVWCVAAEVPLNRYGAEAVEKGVRNLQWVAEVAVAHEEVVEHFTRMRGATAVPMKLFTIFSNPDRARAALSEQRTELTGVLKRLRGCEEWGVRVTRRPESATVRPAPPLQPGSGAQFLLGKKLARDRAREATKRAADAAVEAYELLAPHAREARRRDEPPAGASAPPLLDATFLVPTTRRARFRATARRAAAVCRSAGAELTLSGPWPAYNFVRTPEATT